MRCAARVARAAAAPRLRPRRQPAAVPRDDPRGTACQRDAAAAQRLLPVAPAPRRDRATPTAARARRLRHGGCAAARLAISIRRCSSGSMSAARSPTRCSRRGRLRHGQGADDAGRPVRGRARRGRRRAGAGGRRAGDVERFAHGMTVATNALLEGAVARTALVATEGFTDIVELGRQARRRPLPPVRARTRRRWCPPSSASPPPSAAARTGCSTPLDDATSCARGRRGARRAEAVAVCLLHADRHPEHERRARRALRAARCPGVHVSLSHEIVGTFREYERAATTEVDAALSPLLRRYLRRLARARRRGRAARARDHAVQRRRWPTPPTAAAHAALDRALAARPAARSARGAAGRARRASGDLLCFDMGGTSCDVCVVDGRRACGERRPRGRRAAARAADGRHPHGRRRRRVDRLARRGRRAAGRAALGGRRPGPAVLRPRRHRADGDRRQPRPRLPRRGRRWPAASRSTAAAARALGALGRGAGPRRRSTAARGIVARGQRRDGPGAAGHDRRARHRSARAWRWWPSGAPGRCTPARSPRCSGCGACWCRARRRRALAPSGWRSPSAAATLVRSVLLSGDELTAEAIAEAVELAERGARRAAAPAPSRARSTCATPARRNELTVPGTSRRAGRAARGVRAAHRDRYGYTRSRRRARARDSAGHVAEPGPSMPDRPARAGRCRPHRLVRRRRGGPPCSRGAPPDWRAPPSAPGGSTLVVPPGWAAAAGRRGHHTGARLMDPISLQVMLGALRAACDEMGAVLVRSAHSANIKERRDARPRCSTPRAGW